MKDIHHWSHNIFVLVAMITMLWFMKINVYKKEIASPMSILLNSITLVWNANMIRKCMLNTMISVALVQTFII